MKCSCGGELKVHHIGFFLGSTSYARDEYEWEVFAHEVKSEREITDDWIESLVYHDGDDDITGLEALEISQATA